MIHYRREGEVPAKPHTVMRGEGGALRHEHCFTREGFDGPFSVLYQRAGAQQHGEAAPCDPLWAPREPAAPLAQTALRRQHLRSFAAPSGGAPARARTPLLFNADLTVGVVRPDAADKIYFSNGDGDDLFYVHQGGGRLLSPFGLLTFGPGDYVCVPRAVIHRFELDTGPQHWFWMECRSGLHLPRQHRNRDGQLRMDAPYTHRDFRAPDLAALPAPAGGPVELVSKRADRFSRHTYRHDPLDTVGWDGHVWPFAFHILRFSPRIGQVHLPPTVHGTFATGGSLVCSFVPRMVDFGEGAIPCPYPHSNVEVDEVIFYCEGNFTSRRGIDEGSISLHPAGVPHGPHPGAYEASVGTDRAHELAVMIDTYEPLQITAAGRATEAADYDETWS